MRVSCGRPGRFRRPAPRLWACPQHDGPDLARPAAASRVGGRCKAGCFGNHHTRRSRRSRAAQQPCKGGTNHAQAAPKPWASCPGRRRPPTAGRPAGRWPTCAPPPSSPLLQLHIDDKQNASGSLKISTDHGNARYSISVRSRRPPPRDCWWGHPSLPHVCNTLRLKPTPSWPLPLRQPAHRPAHCAATFKVQTAPDPALSLAPPLRNSGL